MGGNRGYRGFFSYCFGERVPNLSHDCLLSRPGLSVRKRISESAAFLCFISGPRKKRRKIPALSQFDTILHPNSNHNTISCYKMPPQNHLPSPQMCSRWCPGRRLLRSLPSLHLLFSPGSMGLTLLVCWHFSHPLRESLVSLPA